MRFSRLLVLSFVAMLLLSQIPPIACKGKPDSSSSGEESKGKNKNKKTRKKTRSPMSAPSQLSASENPIGSTNFPASQKKSPSPTSAPSQLVSDEMTNSPTNNNLRKTQIPSTNLASTPAGSSNRSSNGSNATVTVSPSSSTSFPEEEIPTIVPIKSPTFDNSRNEQIPTAPIPSPTASNSPTLPLPTQDRSQKSIEDPTVDFTTGTGRSEKSVIMLVSLVALLGAMVAIVVWQLNNRRLRSWESDSIDSAFLSMG